MILMKSTRYRFCSWRSWVKIVMSKRQVWLPLSVRRLSTHCRMTVDIVMRLVPVQPQQTSINRTMYRLPYHSLKSSIHVLSSIQISRYRRFTQEEWAGELTETLEPLLTLKIIDRSLDLQNLRSDHTFFV